VIEKLKKFVSTSFEFFLAIGKLDWTHAGLHCCVDLADLQTARGKWVIF
jgi:hypothetical protein